MIRFIALGTSATFPTEKRNHPSYFFEYKGVGFLLDVGENTQRQMRIAKISPKNIDYIFISHWHGDHMLGLPGVLFNLANSGYSKTLNIITHKEYVRKIEKVIDVFNIPINFEINVISISDEETIEFRDFYLKIGELRHSIETLYFKFVEKDYWRLDKNLLRKYNIHKKIRIIKDLKNKGYSYINGDKISIEDVGYVKRGFKFTYITDTIFFKELYEIARDSDVLLIESTYFNNKDLAKKNYHLDFEEVYDIFKKSNSKLALLTHISQRYDDEIDKIVETIKNIPENDRIYILNDFDRFYFHKDKIELIVGNKKYRYYRNPKTGKLFITS